MNNSPFSLSHDWDLRWKIVPSHMKAHKHVNGESPKERKALQALACVGVIGGLQLSRLFFLDKTRLKKMVYQKKIIRHEIKKNNQIIPIYTLGVNGAIIGEVTGYENNYWLEYRIEDVLKRLLFFKLYEHFPYAKLFPSPNPFVASFIDKGKHYYVYVVRGAVDDLARFLKWNTFKDRLLIIVENENHLNLLAPFLEEIEVRIAFDKTLNEKEKQNVFCSFEEIEKK